VKAVEDLARSTRIDRVPPHNMDAEESVLGSMMLSAEAIASVVEVLKAEDFYRSAHQRIHESILAIYARGEPVDVITTVEDLKRRQILDAVGGPLYLYQLVEQVPTPASAGYYARIVSEHALLRRLIEAAGQIMAKAYQVSEDPRKVADEAEALIYAVSRHRETEQVITIRELVDESMAALEHIHQRDSRFAGVPTGFVDLDELTSGLQPGNLIVVAARPGVGKSSFVTNLARNIAVGEGAQGAPGSPVLMFSLEMSRFEIGMRLLCGEARVAWDKVRSGRVATDEWTRIADAAETLHEAPLYIVDSGNVTIVDIRAKARRLRSSRQGLGLVIVDYLQLMQGHGRSESRQQEVAEISRSLKLLAKELEIPVIAVSQLNRNPESRGDKRPQLSDLRESGAIEQDADIVMFIHREDSDDPQVKGKADLIVAKHRNGPTRSIPLTFLPHITQFRNYVESR
jgi:replicative DNA helicase